MTMKWIEFIDWKKQPLYIEIASAIEQGISVGNIKEGDKLPTHRQLADFLKVAIGTVTKSYKILENKKIIFGNGRRGTVVGKPKDGKDSLISLINNDDKLIDFSINYPALVGEDILTSAFQKVGSIDNVSDLFRYQSPHGLESHVNSGIKWLKNMGVEASKRSIVLTAGAQHGLNVVFSTIASENEIVLTENYTYPGIKAVSEMYKFKLKGVISDNYGIIPEEIEKICKEQKVRAIYLIPTLQNPTNTILTIERRKEIAKLSKKYDFFIVEDDIHRALVENPPETIESFANDRTFFISSVSKVICGGLRVAFIKCPKEFKDKLIGSLQTLVWNVSPIPFEIFNILTNENLTEKIVNLRKVDAKNRNEILSAKLSGFNLNQYNTSYFCWLNLPENWTQLQFFLEAKKQGISVSPAETFSVSKLNQVDAVRICHGTPSSYNLLSKGLDKIRKILIENPTTFNLTI